MQRLSDVIAQRASRQLLGRHRELDHLEGLLARDALRVVHVHGVQGIGKSALLALFTARASSTGAHVVALDGRALEPTASAVLGAIAEQADVEPRTVEGLATGLAAMERRVVLLLDGYETMRLVDTWLRRTLLPALPDNVRVVIASRERPAPGWITRPGLSDVVATLELGPLATVDALQLLHDHGVGVVAARRLAEQLQRHPLALRLAIAALKERHELELEADALQQALERLTEMVMDDIRDPVLRDATEVSALVRRVTRPLLEAMCPGVDDARITEAVGEIAFVEAARDGLRVHEAIRPALQHYLRARDPIRYREARRRAWYHLTSSSSSAPRDQLWRYTADILYLVEHPVVREAFFPSGASRLTVEPARPRHDADVRAIARAHEGPSAAAHLLDWWARVPGAFHVAIDRDERCVGLHATFDPADVAPRWLDEDPVTAAWARHLVEQPLASGQRALFLRRWLSRDDGEGPSDAQAACWLDIKRLYMEKRPTLRRVYLTVVDLDAYGEVADELGFEPLEGTVTLDGREYRSAVLDFGPGSVDGWLAELAAAGLGIRPEDSILDARARELVGPDGRTELTPLEFGLLRYLMAREGQAVSRDVLLRDVWQTAATTSSNVVDAVVASLRRKLGEEARRLQTVRGVGYRYRR